ncbi:hypothetical protein G6F40_015544 [Rhizopus arrhizus]|nr:hypothetical protein G6F40_015544 [Rhizopus arrhizus]
MRCPGLRAGIAFRNPVGQPCRLRIRIQHASVPGVNVAGDGAAIAGADAAELAGERAALALLEDIDHPHDAQRARGLEAQLAANSRLRTALERAFPFPEDWAQGIADDTVVCRCEEVTAGTR